VTQARRALGAGGEAAVAAWYVEHGYDVVERNWRCRTGELDLILRRGRTFGTPAEAVTRTKQARLRHLAAQWLEDAPLHPTEIRFDVASVLAGEIEVLEGAF
jgi:putative endonuclease